MKPALLVIDVQKAFFQGDPVKVQSLNRAVAFINGAIGFFRAKALPVISIQHIDAEDRLVPGTEGFELPDNMNILETDIHIHKTYMNAFNKTPLLTEIQKLGVDTIFLSGYCAENCVLSTCRGARDVDLTPVLIRGAIASGNLENIKFVESINDIISMDALQKILE